MSVNDKGLIFSAELPTEAELFNLYEKLGWNDFLKLPPSLLLEGMRNSFFSVYVYDDNMLIATGRVVSDGVMNAYICGVGVLSEYRNRGIGTEIMKKLLSHSQKHNLHAQFFCEEALVPFYRKMGFEVFAVGMKA